MPAIQRSFDRSTREARPITIEPGYLKHAEGSALIALGDTKVLCTASVEAGVPGWLRGIALFLPYPYMMYAPARLASTFSWEACARLMPVQFLYGLVIFGLAHLVYRKGAKWVHANGG